MLRKQIINNFKNYLPLLLTLSVTGLAAILLRVLPVKASAVTPVSVAVSSSCSFSADADTHSATITSGLLEELDGITLTSICNGAYDSQILAIGFTNNVEGNTALSSTTNTINTLDNCSPISPSSCWSMKVTGLDTDTYPFTPQNNYDTYKSIPEKETLIAKTELKTEANPKSTLKTTYNIYTTTTQPAGTYTGKVKYTLATRPAVLNKEIGDLIYMQDFAKLSADDKRTVLASMKENRQYKLKDNRDKNEYYFAKLETNQNAPGGVIEEDGKYYQVWMTQNLDLCIGCDGTAELTSENTDLNVSGRGIYSDGYATDDGSVITWAPVSTAITSGRTVPIGTGDVGGAVGYVVDYNIPYSAEGGGTYVITSDNDGVDTVGTACDAGVAICSRYKRGNYYNWSAAVASNDTSSFTTNYAKTDNSICPAGWMLPTGMTVENGYSDYNYLLVAQGIATNFVGVAANSTWTAGGFVDIRANPLYLIRAGGVYSDWLSNSGVLGGYWTGTVYSGDAAYNMYFYGGGVFPSNNSYRYDWWSVRCLVR